MRGCIIHIGMHKTGSTAIQQTLNNFQNNKFYYAKLGDPNHSISLYCLFSQKPDEHYALKELTKDEIEKRRIYIREKLIKSIEEAGDRMLIISGEDLSLLSDIDLKKLKNFLETEINQNIKVIGYVRNPYEYISSDFQERLKAHFINLYELNEIYPKYRDRFEKFFKVFGEERVLLKKFDPKSFPDADVVLDFCQTFGIEISRDMIKRMNESFPKEIVSLIYILRKYKTNISLEAPEIQFLGESLKNLFHDLNLNKFRIDSTLIKPIVAKNLDDIRWMEEKLCESLLDEKAEEIEGIKNEKELMDVRKDVIERLRMYVDYSKAKLSYKPEEIADVVYDYYNIIKSSFPI